MICALWRFVKGTSKLDSLFMSNEDRGVVDALLAQRAVAHLPYAQLLSFTPTPAADLRDGRFGLLADAELAYLGLRRKQST